MRFTYNEVERWPRLAWLARCRPGADVIEVWHGPGIECRREWFCEAVWDGPFSQGGFDRTDIMFGSGARIRGDHVLFATSTATVDRLQYLESNGRTYLSNSLPCLLFWVGAELEPTFPHYMPALRSIVAGLGRYRRDLPTTRGPVELSYGENLLWNGEVLERQAKPWRSRAFSSFSKYVDFLGESIGRLAGNLSARDRTRPFRMLGTVSAGYDSATVAALARPHGLNEVVTFGQGRAINASAMDLPDDSGAQIASFLGLRVREIQRHAWRRNALAASLFLAGDGNGQEVVFGGVEPFLAGTVLFTGMSGDTVWSMEDKVGDGLLARGDQSGLSLTEYRLHVGFLHVPVPFLGAQQRQDIRALSQSAEQQPWSIGGHYDRPICRRVLEGKGVPRTAFGMTKTAASVRFSLRRVFWNSAFHRHFVEWLTARRGLWIRRGRIPPVWVSRLARPGQALMSLSVRLLDRAFGRRIRRFRLIRRLEYLGSREFLYRYIFPWAVSSAMESYACDSLVDREGARVNRRVLMASGPGPASSSPATAAE